MLKKKKVSWIKKVVVGEDQIKAKWVKVLRLWSLYSTVAKWNGEDEWQFSPEDNQPQQTDWNLLFSHALDPVPLRQPPKAKFE